MDKEQIVEDVKRHIGSTNLDTYTNPLGRFVVEVDWTTDTVSLWHFRGLYQCSRLGTKIAYFGMNKECTPYHAIIIFEAV